MRSINDVVVGPDGSVSLSRRSIGAVSVESFEVQVTIDKARHDGHVLKVDDPGRGPLQRTDVGRRADEQNASVANRNRFRPRTIGIERVDAAADQDDIGRTIGLLPPCAIDQRRGD